MSEVELKEIATDESGKTLWEEPYMFKRLSAPNEYIVVKGVGYIVVSSTLDDKTVRTVVRLAAKEESGRRLPRPR